MSRKPQTPRDNGPAGNSQTRDIPAGDRYTGNPEILRIEEELLDDGVDLDNPAKPIEEHPENDNFDDVDDVQAAIKSEVSKDNPDRDRIGQLNRLLEQKR